MTLATQLFHHSAPSVPTRAGGMLLGASGVSIASLQAFGGFSGTSSADGSFSDTTGYGQIDHDSAGYMYVADAGNNRVQRFSLVAGVWTYHSKVVSLSTLLGGGSAPNMVAIDRSRDQIHIAARDHYTASNWISVWNLSDWPNLTTLNRVRQYGANASSNVADRAFNGISLTIDDTFAVVSSLSSPFRQLRWNHMTGALLNQDASSIIKGAWATDGAGLWWYCIGFGSANAGLYRADPATFAAGTRLDVAAVGSSWRRNRFVGGGPLSPVYYNGKIYCRTYFGQLMAWNTADAFLDEYALTGPLGPSDSHVGTSGWSSFVDVFSGRSGVVIDSNGGVWLIAWSANANNAGSQGFLSAWPISTATATWTKDNWSAGLNTLQSLSIKGTNLSGEKFKIRLRKDAGAWVTVTGDLLQDAPTLNALTFTGSEVLTVELSLSVGDRLDGHPTLHSTRDKLSPSNVAILMHYDDTAATTYVPQPTSEYQLMLDAGPSYQLQLD